MRKVFVSLTLLLFLVATVFVITNDSIGGLRKKGDKGQRFAKPSTITRPRWNPNRIADYITNNGQLVSQVPTNSAGMEWPAGSNNTINYASGLWVGGKKNGEIVVAVGEYAVEFQPGPILPNGQAADPNSPNYRIYTINQSDFDDPSQNLDFAAWPYDDGAPFTLAADGSKMPSLLGTSTTWCVYNDLDEVLHGRLLATKPVGIEVQQTAWAFNRPDAFGDMLFFKFAFINKGGVDVTDTYVSFWADIDVGDAADLVGCDTTRSLGYMYKTQADGLYGNVAPAIGYDFFQGPIVPSPGDTANVSGRRIPGFKNLPMSSFAKYINAGPTQYRDPETGPEAYNFMLGLDRVGDPIINPQTTQVTKFWHAGNPVDGSGWLDDVHGDKRFLMTCGPFTLAAGDTQEVVGGMVIAQGTDAPSTISILKQADESAQVAYNNNFALPRNPSAPTVKITTEKDAILLKWDDHAETYEEVDKFHVVNGVPTNYRFQGYNVYQTDELTLGTTTTVKKIATFDIIDDNFQDIKDFVLDPARGEFVEVTVQKPRDTGVQRYLRITQDAIRGNQPLIPNRRYYFAVTSYGYNQESFAGKAGGPYAIESTMRPLLAIPQDQPLGNALTSASGDTLTVTRTGASDGSVTTIVVEPAALTGHEYEVRFRDTANGTVYDVWDRTTNTRKDSNRTNQGEEGAYNYPIVDGVLVQVIGSAPGMKRWDIPSGTRRFSPVGGFAGLGLEGFSSSTAPEAYDQSSGTIGMAGHLAFGGIGTNLKTNQYHTVLLKLAAVDNTALWDPKATPTDPNFSKAYRYLRAATAPPARPEFAPWIINATSGYPHQDFNYAAPFSAWDMETDPPTRLAVGTFENNVAGGAVDGRYWPPDAGGVTLDGDNTVAREFAFIFATPYSETPDPSLMVNISNNSTTPLMWVMVCNRRAEGPWTAGDEFLITANHVNSPTVTFSYKSVAPIKADAAVAKQQAKFVNVFPNPYVGFNIEERDPVNRFVTFTHLTPNAKIRIFTLAGELVRTIEHTDGTQLERWDLRNANDVPVASGIYIAHIELPNVGQKVLKLAVFQPEERLDVF